MHLTTLQMIFISLQPYRKLHKFATTNSILKKKIILDMHDHKT